MSVRVTRVTTKGQVVIPKALRDRAGLTIGDSVSLTTNEERVHLTKRSGWARATAGCLPSSLPPIEPDAIDELAEHAANEELREKYRIAR